MSARRSHSPDAHKTRHARPLQTPPHVHLERRVARARVQTHLPARAMAKKPPAHGKSSRGRQMMHKVRTNRSEPPDATPPCTDSPRLVP